MRLRASVILLFVGCASSLDEAGPASRWRRRSRDIKALAGSNASTKSGASGDSGSQRSGMDRVPSR